MPSGDRDVLGVIFKLLELGGLRIFSVQAQEKFSSQWRKNGVAISGWSDTTASLIASFAVPMGVAALSDGDRAEVSKRRPLDLVIFWVAYSKILICS